MLYVFYNDVDSNPCAALALAQLENPQVRVVPAGKRLFLFRNSFARLALHLGFRLKIPLMLNFSRDFIRLVKGIKEEDSILVFGSGICVSPRIAFPFFKICKAKRRFKWVWDSVLDAEDEKWLLELKECFDVFTFDKSDAKKYGLTYKNTVCAEPPKAAGSSAQDQNAAPASGAVDLYFVGYDRGRYERLNALFEKCAPMGLSCKFLVVRDESSPSAEKSIPLMQKGIAPQENYKNLLNARSVLDIPAQGQHGLTQRTAEGLFLRKKIVTDNPFVKDEALFNEQNVFILGERDTSELPSFIRSPFAPVDLKPYTINEWIKTFLS